MRNLKRVSDTLVTLNGFVDNEYLYKYAQLVERNFNTKQVPRKTNSHHIVPKVWFSLNGKDVDNDPTNLVNLVYRDHILAHYYLCLCTEGKLKFANQLALILLCEKKKISYTDRQLIRNLPLYNYIIEDYKLKKKENYKLYE